MSTGCISLPSDFEQVPGVTWQYPEQTRLGKFFEGYAPEDPELSGVYLLSDPRAAFHARFGFAGLAEKTLDLQYYLWKGDLTGRLLLYRALQAADRGVKVRILIDDIYHSGRDDIYAAIALHPGVDIRIYNPTGYRGIAKNISIVFHKRTLDHRMHNKIFLVDGVVAVLGGRNIGDDYFEIDPELNFRDIDVLTVGPAARDAGAAFDEYWNGPAAVPINVLVKESVPAAELDTLRQELESALNNIDAVPYTVPVTSDETIKVLEELAEDFVWAKAEIVVDSLERFHGRTESAFVKLANRLAQVTEHDMVIQTAYLIPSRAGIARMAAMTERGVRIRILTNSLESNNHISVHSHYMKWRKPMLKAGIELYELRPDPEMLDYFKEQNSRIADSHAGLHTKAFVVDGRFSMIGSYNMDPRSRIWNSEIGLLVDSKEFAARVLDVMEEDFDPVNSYRVSLRSGHKLTWSAKESDGSQNWNHDPGSSRGLRFLLRIMSWIPFGKEL